MKITISKQETLTFVPEEQDDVPEGERFTLLADPLSLSFEEEVYDLVQGGEKKGHTRQINECFRRHVTGWQNTGIPWDDAYARDVPDWAIAGTPMVVRGAFFAFLLNQAGLKGEVEVGESE